MGKFANPDILDAALIALSQATHMVATAGQPRSFAEANSGKLAEALLTSADFSFSDGDISGRKATVAAKSGLEVIAGGTADHVSLLDVPGSRLLYVTTCPAQMLIEEGTVAIANWSVEIGSPE